jgi:hypothetical protein
MSSADDVRIHANKRLATERTRQLLMPPPPPLLLLLHR